MKNEDDFIIIIINGFVLYLLFLIRNQNGYKTASPSL